MNEQNFSAKNIHRRIDETQDRVIGAEERIIDSEQHIDALHSTIIVVLASLANAGVRLVDEPGALRTLFARVGHPPQPPTDSARNRQPVAPVATNGAAEMNRHVLAKAV